MTDVKIICVHAGPFGSSFKTGSVAVTFAMGREHEYLHTSKKHVRFRRKLLQHFEILEDKLPQYHISSVAKGNLRKSVKNFLQERNEKRLLIVSMQPNSRTEKSEKKSQDNSGKVTVYCCGRIGSVVRRSSCCSREERRCEEFNLYFRSILFLQAAVENCSPSQTLAPSVSASITDLCLTKFWSRKYWYLVLSRSVYTTVITYLSEGVAVQTFFIK